MNNPEVTPIAVAGIVFLAVFGVLIAYMGVNEDLPNFTLMGTSLFILSVSGSVSLLIDRFASRAMPKSRIARIEDGVAMRPHRVSTVRLALNALGASSSVTFLASFVPIVRVFPGSLFTMVIDVAILLVFFSSYFLCCGGAILWVQYFLVFMVSPGPYMGGLSPWDGMIFSGLIRLEIGDNLPIMSRSLRIPEPSLRGLRFPVSSITAVYHGKMWLLECKLLTFSVDLSFWTSSDVCGEPDQVLH